MGSSASSLVLGLRISPPPDTAGTLRWIAPTVPALFATWKGGPCWDAGRKEPKIFERRDGWPVPDQITGVTGDFRE